PLRLRRPCRSRPLGVSSRRGSHDSECHARRRRAVASFDRSQARCTPDDARRTVSNAATVPPMSEPWPDLTLSEWQDTRDTLHMWTQVVGKVRLGLEPMINHWWQVTLYVSARGLTTSIMPAGD